LHKRQRHVRDGLVEQLQHRGANRARGDHSAMGRLLVDSFSRHIRGFVRKAGPEFADRGRHRQTLRAAAVGPTSFAGARDIVDGRYVSAGG